MAALGVVLQSSDPKGVAEEADFAYKSSLEPGAIPCQDALGLIAAERTLRFPVPQRR